MASLHQRTRKHGISYRICYRYNGKQISEHLPIGTSLTRANLVLSEFNKRLHLDKLGAVPFESPLKERTSPLSLGAFKEWFLENKKTAIRRGRLISKKTDEANAYAFKKLIEAVGATTRLSDIPKQQSAIEEHLGHLSPTSQSIVIRHLRAAWQFGITKGITDSNPFKSIPVTQEKKIPEVLTLAEKDLVYQNLESPEVKIGFALARYAGLRPVEICRNIQWENIDWDARIITIPDAKTGQDQKVPMIQQLKDLLLPFRKDEGFLVSLIPTSLSHAIRFAIKQAGIKKKGAVRILRHSFGHELLQQGVDIRTIQLLLRHSNISTTMIYTQIPTQGLIHFLDGKHL